ncbi:MAG: hypothetical protein CMH64_01955 [Nanoarchaeota archaeon]|nr:hypothetical protein [Nanoarchaeota archaeon]
MGDAYTLYRIVGKDSTVAWFCAPSQPEGSLKEILEATLEKAKTYEVVENGLPYSTALNLLWDKNSDLDDQEKVDKALAAVVDSLDGEILSERDH